MIPLSPATPDALRRAADALRAGGLVAFPTETVYGLGAKAHDPLALAKIFEAKRRPFFDPLILHVAERSQFEALIAPEARRDPRATDLMDRFWPGPLTLVLPKASDVPDLATSGLPTVAVRMPAHPVALALIRAAGFPLAAPSANPFGRLSPTTAAHVQAHFQAPFQAGEAGIDLILDGGPCTVGVESTIVSLAGETPVLLRAGGVPREAIEAAIGAIAMAPAAAARPQAPGQLPGHYAPRTPLRIHAGEEIPSDATLRLGYLAFRRAPDGPYAATETLSPDGDLREAAARLFACLHRLDAAGLDLILAEAVPERGLGAAIMDRLRKAAAGSGPG
ncbi:MAG: threonylcarbamoyl-AMP synthase [Fibrobacteres bacterium]|nr:threonylcarbamoyl-AMP synthase [Fibrobacterota bacterium]